MRRLTTGVALGLALGLIPLANHTMAAGAFDGTYAGQKRETQNNQSGYCHDTNGVTMLAVKDNVISYRWGVPLEGPVAGDGSFSVEHQGMAMRGAAAMISIKGRISGGNLEADVGSNLCAAHLSLKKK